MCCILLAQPIVSHCLHHTHPASQPHNLLFSGPVCFKQQEAMQHSLEGQVAERAPFHSETRRHVLSPTLKPEPQQPPPPGKAVTKSFPHPRKDHGSLLRVAQGTCTGTCLLQPAGFAALLLLSCYPAHNPFIQQQEFSSMQRHRGMAMGVMVSSNVFSATASSSGMKFSSLLPHTGENPPQTSPT